MKSLNQLRRRAKKLFVYQTITKQLLNMLLIQVPLTRFSQMLGMQIVDCAAF